jgi:Leucine-rich repeat (LRR) protein
LAAGFYYRTRGLRTLRETEFKYYPTTEKPLSALVTLELEQLNRISNFSILSKLTSLEGLGIDGSIWTAQKIDTLKPLKTLFNLKYLTVTNTRIQDKSFDPLLKLVELVRFNSSWNYPEAEFDKLKSLPNLKYGNVETSWREVKEKLYR